MNIQNNFIWIIFMKEMVLRSSIFMKEDFMQGDFGLGKNATNIVDSFPVGVDYP